MKSNKIILPNPHFFIVGVGRAGTTLLMSMLNAHPKITLPPEIHFVRRHIVSNCSVSLKKAESILRNDRYFPRLDIDISKIISFFQNSNTPFRWDITYWLILKEYLSMSSKKYIGDKDPKSIEYLPILHKLFPESKILHIIRDPRDVFASRQKANWSKKRNWFSHIMTYRIQFLLGRHYGLLLFKDNYFEVQYERLIKDPETNLKEISSFLEIEYSAKMLDFSQSAKKIVAKDEIQWKKNVIRPLLTNNFGKWKQNLNRKQIIYIENICNSVFQLGLYKKAYPKLFLLERWEINILRISAWICEFIYKKMLNTRIRIAKKSYSLIT